MILTTIIFLVVSYLLGSINSAVITCKLFGLPSPRTVGSGNPGATNVLRLGSKKAAGITLFGDLIKGVIPVFVAHFFFHSYFMLAWVGLAAVVGHMFPIWFKFKGGKGVATTLGVLIALHPLLGAAFVLTWLIVALLFRYSSLAALVATVLSPFYGWIMLSPQVFLPVAIIAVLVIYRHRANINRLMTKTENKIKLKKREA